MVSVLECTLQFLAPFRVRVRLRVLAGSLLQNVRMWLCPLWTKLT